MQMLIQNGEKLAKINRQDGEYRVRLYVSGQYQKDADAFETDRCAAFGTARAMIGLVNLTQEQTEELEYLKQRYKKNWRVILKHMFATGKDGYNPVLRQIRNTIGDLDAIRLPSES